MDSEKMVIPRTIHDKMLEHGQSCLPYEACGLLSGNDHYVTSIWPLENERKSTKHFFVSKAIVQETLSKLEKLNEQVLAVYHSHPTTAPVPSFRDITNHLDENVKMVIISYKMRTPITKWYHIKDFYYETCPFWIEPTR